MLRTLSAVGASAFVMLTASLAHAQAAPGTAQGFGQQGEFIFSADRLFPLFAYSHVSEGQANNDPNVQSDTVSVNQTSLSFFWGLNGSILNGTSTFFTVPRLGFDYTIVDKVTVGGDLIGFFTLGGSTNDHVVYKDGHTVDTSAGAPSTTVLGIAPRGGYVLGLNDIFAIWLRGGFSYYHGALKSNQTDGNGNVIATTTDSLNVFAIDLDPQFVIAPVPHFAFTVGPAIDIPLGGSASTEVDAGGQSRTTSFDYSQFNFSINAGLMGWFGGP
jgi:hypothetical protein